MEKYDQVYHTVCEMICDAKDLEMTDMAPEMSLYQLKLDSLDYVELMVLAKREFGATLSADMFIENPNLTLGELCQNLSDQQK